MNGKTIFFACLLAAGAFLPVFSQTKDLDVDKMRADALQSQKKTAAWYDIVDVKKTGDTFEILYNINASQEEEYEVSVALVRDSDPAFRVVPRLATGKIGTGSFAGKNNSILWNYKKELLKDLKGNDYRFDLSVRRIERGSFPWLWVGLGTAAAGGAAILVLGKKGGENVTPPIETNGAIPAIGISRPY